MNDEVKVNSKLTKLICRFIQEFILKFKKYYLRNN